MTQVFMDITGAHATARKTGLLTAGMVGVPVQFSFSPEWAELNCLAVFRAGEVKKDNTITGGRSVIPAEVLEHPGQRLYMGVEGRSEQGDVVIPTVWAEVGQILEGAQASNDSGPVPIPGQFEQLLAQVDEKIESALQEAKESGRFDGPPGDDYVLTSADKTEIAKQAAGMVEIPTDDHIGALIDAKLKDNSSDSNGLNDTARALLVTILRSAVYTGDQSANITALEAALASDSGSGGGDSGDDNEGTETVTYTVTSVLSNVTTNNALTSVAKNTAYTATLTAAEGYELDSVTVTMGGADITAATYNSGVVTIPAVTGNVVITATAKASSPGGDSGDDNEGTETVTYTITNTLTNVTTSNAAASVAEKTVYTATLSAADGYALGAVTVTMGGVDITAATYNSGVVTIPAVTGNVVITATAKAATSGGGVVNLFDKNTMVTNGYFINTSGAPAASGNAKYATVPITGGNYYALQKRNEVLNSDWNIGAAGAIAYLDSEMNTVSTLSIPNDSKKPWVANTRSDFGTDSSGKGIWVKTPVGASYIRLTICLGTDFTDTFMVEEGDTCHDYVAYT